MKNKTFDIKIVTPEKSVFEGKVEQATIPAKEGEATILPEHIPYIAALRAGELLTKVGKEETSIAISGGFIEFSKNTLIVLADTAERAEDIDLKRAEEARKRAENIKNETAIDDIEFATVAAAIEKEMSRIKVARKHHSRKGISFE